ncbi:hypothetical protein HDN1F_36720 [gamma proteobacterium HdN1]|nr:hypothetical protein HDN1F_36720 [gamma proteobacterium HdN1]
MDGGLRRPPREEMQPLQGKAAAIDAAVFDLKAVNLNAVAVVDERTPGEVIQSITAQGRIVADALARLNCSLSDKPPQARSHPRQCSFAREPFAAQG